VPRFLIIFVLLAVIVYVISIVDCALQPPTRHRGVSKPAWILIVVLLPVVGGLLWFIIGRGRANSGGRSGPRAPDDDPDFLRSLGSTAEQDERIRRLEEELAKLDDPDSPDAEPPTEPGDDDRRGPAA